MTSDYLPCLCVSEDMYPMKMEHEYQTSQNYSNKNIEEIKVDLKSKDWNNIMKDSDCNKQFNAFHDELMSIIDCQAPKVMCLIKAKSK